MVELLLSASVIIAIDIIYQVTVATPSGPSTS